MCMQLFNLITWHTPPLPPNSCWSTAAPLNLKTQLNEISKYEIAPGTR